MSDTQVHYDPLNQTVTLTLDGGKRVCVDKRHFDQVGIAGALRAIGVDLPTGRVDVRWHGKVVGSVPALFHPALIKSQSFLYDVRPGDFCKVGEEWVASNTLGAGDLSAVPGFQWADDPDRARRDVAEDRELLRAIFKDKSHAG